MNKKYYSQQMIYLYIFQECITKDINLVKTKIDVKWYYKEQKLWLTIIGFHVCCSTILFSSKSVTFIEVHIGFWFYEICQVNNCIVNRLFFYFLHIFTRHCNVIRKDQWLIYICTIIKMISCWCSWSSH